MHYGVWERFDWILKIFLDVAFADRLFFCAGGLGPVFWVWLFIRSSSTWGMTGFCRQWLGIRDPFLKDQAFFCPSVSLLCPRRQPPIKHRIHGKFSHYSCVYTHTQYEIYFSASVYSSVCVHTDHCILVYTHTQLQICVYFKKVHIAVCTGITSSSQRLAAGLLYL